MLAIPRPPDRSLFPRREILQVPYRHTVRGYFEPSQRSHPVNGRHRLLPGRWIVNVTTSSFQYFLIEDPMILDSLSPRESGAYQIPVLSSSSRRTSCFPVGGSLSIPSCTAPKFAAFHFLVSTSAYGRRCLSFVNRFCHRICGFRLLCRSRQLSTCGQRIANCKAPCLESY